MGRSSSRMEMLKLYQRDWVKNGSWEEESSNFRGVWLAFWKPGRYKPLYWKYQPIYCDSGLILFFCFFIFIYIYIYTVVHTDSGMDRYPYVPAGMSRYEPVPAGILNHVHKWVQINVCMRKYYACVPFTCAKWLQTNEPYKYRHEILYSQCTSILVLIPFKKQEEEEYPCSHLVIKWANVHFLVECLQALYDLLHHYWG